MKTKVLSFIAVLILVGLFMFSNNSEPTDFNSKSSVIPCTKPLTYRIAKIDSRYDISKQEAKAVMQNVETIWESAMERELLNYHEKGAVEIHLIYSEQQQRTADEQKLSRRIRQMKQQASAVKQKYRQFSNNYQNKRSRLRDASATYKQAVEKFNATVKKWNRNGGIPQNKKAIIKKKKRRISQLEEEVQRVKQNAELLRRRTNAKSRQLNDLIDRQNKAIKKYNRRFAKRKKFNQGHYIKEGNKERINIYQFRNLAELKTVLAHEAGHAMGLAHVEDPESVMHKMMGEQDIFNLSLTDADSSALGSKCGW